MAVSPKQSYSIAAGGSAPHHHMRRPSLHRTFSPGPGVSAPRTHCPKDVDAFSYDPSHLQEWSMPEGLWRRMPGHLRSSIVNMQRAGAAVLTGFDRLRKMKEELQLDGIEEMCTSDDEDVKSTQTAEQSDIAALLNAMTVDFTKDTRKRHDSLEMSDPPTPSLTPLSSSTSVHSAASTPPAVTPPSSTPLTPISPFVFSSKPHQQEAFPDLSPRSSFSFTRPEIPPMAIHLESTTLGTAAASMVAGKLSAPLLPLHPHGLVAPPRHPHASYYAAELAELRCVSLVRLRHSVRKVDAEWNECKRTGNVVDFSTTPTAEVEGPQSEEERIEAQVQSALEAVQEFEMWWAGQKGMVGALEERVRRVEGYKG